MGYPGPPFKRCRYCGHVASYFGRCPTCGDRVLQRSSPSHPPVSVPPSSSVCDYLDFSKPEQRCVILEKYKKKDKRVNAEEIEAILCGKQKQKVDREKDK